jgi:hypothetical protein
VDAMPPVDLLPAKLAGSWPSALGVGAVAQNANHCLIKPPATCLKTPRNLIDNRRVGRYSGFVF